MTTDEIHERIQFIDDWRRITPILEHMNNRIAELEKRLTVGGLEDYEGYTEHEKLLLRCWKHKCDTLISENEALKMELSQIKDDLKHSGIERDLAH